MFRYFITELWVVCAEADGVGARSTIPIEVSLRRNYAVWVCDPQESPKSHWFFGSSEALIT